MGATPSAQPQVESTSRGPPDVMSPQPVHADLVLPGSWRLTIEYPVSPGVEYDYRFFAVVDGHFAGHCSQVQPTSNRSQTGTTAKFLGSLEGNEITWREYCDVDSDSGAELDSPIEFKAEFKATLHGEDLETLTGIGKALVSPGCEASAVYFRAMKREPTREPDVEQEPWALPYPPPQVAPQHGEKIEVAKPFKMCL